MPRYRFQLASIQKLRESHRDQQRERLAEAVYAQTELTARSEAVANEIAEITAKQRAALRSENIDLNAIIDRQRYELLLKAHEKTLLQQAATLDEETQRRRATLSEADGEVRVLEKLNERRRREFQQAEERKEDQRLSEVALQQYVRRQLR
jgi:flagellar export protein FliJ